MFSPRAKDQVFLDVWHVAVVAALVVIGVAAAHMVHLLMWKNAGVTPSDMDMVWLVAGGVAIVAILYLIVSGRLFTIKAAGVDLEVGGNAGEIADDVNQSGQVIRVSDVLDGSALSRIDKSLDTILKIPLGTLPVQIETALTKLDQNGTTPAVVAIVNKLDQPISQIDTPTLRRALADGTKDAALLKKAIQEENARLVRSNALTSSVLKPNAPPSDALGHMVTEKLDTMILTDADNKISKIIDRRALADKVIEASLA